MRKLQFAVLQKNFPDKDDVTQEALFAEIGYPELGMNAYWSNTCAIRVSLALVRSGVTIPGQMTIKAGKFKGRRVEQNQARLTRYLQKPALFGNPEVYEPGTAAQTGIGQRRGIISFYNLNGPTDVQGHIDIVAPDAGGYLRCSASCYWKSVKILFWPLL